MQKAANRLASGTGATALVALLLLSISTNANAAEGDRERGFPEIVPEWYVTAPPFAYIVAPPAPYMDDSLIAEGFSATYFTPDGGAPGPGQGDLSLRYAPPLSLAEPSEVSIDLAAFERLQTDLRTSFIDALVIPEETKYIAGTDVVKPTPTIELHQSVLSISRPSLPCVIDPYDYQFQVAFLGDNGFKYLADIDVNFGDRPETGPDCDIEAIISPDTSSALPRDTASPAPRDASNKGSDDPDDVEDPVNEETDNESSNALPEPTVDTDESYGVLPLMIAGGLLLAVAGIVAVVISRRKKTQFNSDGSLSSSVVGATGSESE